MLEDPDIFWFHCQPNGTPERMTDREGYIRWEGQNSAWGKLLHESIPQERDYAQNLRMQGQYLDRETGLHYNLFRYYDPDSARFTRQDPIGLAGINLCQYAPNAPNALSWVDPLGLSCSSDAKALRENMVAAGKVEPNFKNSAHHIIMSNPTDSRMVALQNKMKTLGIDINTAENGIFFPSTSKVQLPAGNTLPNQESIHTNAYKQKVFDRLKSINNSGDLLNELNKINSGMAGGIL